MKTEELNPNNEIADVTEVIGSVKLLHDLVDQQIKLRASQGKPDPRLIILKRGLYPLTVNHLLRENQPVKVEAKEGGIGSVVSKSGAKVATNEPTGENDNGEQSQRPKIGEVVKARKEETVDNNPKVKTETHLTEEDNEFLKTIAATPLEKLSGNKYSKESLLAIVKKINGPGEPVIVIEDVDNAKKADIAEKILAQLNKSATNEPTV